MDEVRDAFRNAEVEAKKKLRDLDGDDREDDIPNAEDEATRPLGDLGDDVHRTADDTRDDAANASEHPIDTPR